MSLTVTPSLSVLDLIVNDGAGRGVGVGLGRGVAVRAGATEPARLGAELGAAGAPPQPATIVMSSTSALVERNNGDGSSIGVSHPQLALRITDQHAARRDARGDAVAERVGHRI